MNIKSLDTINKSFAEFSQATLNRRATTNYLLSHLKSYEKDYRRAGALELFLKQVYQLADNCFKKGLNDFAGMMYSSMIKNEAIPDNIREIIINRAIEVTRAQKDPIHELARVVDLKHLYLRNPETTAKKKLKNNIAEETLLKKIINNFDDSTDNFKTVKKNSNQLDLYRFRLALVEVDIAKATIRTEKKSALKKLVHAKKIFNELGKTTEAKFAQQLINQIDYRY